jgi:hypothetical protein
LLVQHGADVKASAFKGDTALGLLSCSTGTTFTENEFDVNTHEANRASLLSIVCKTLNPLLAVHSVLPTSVTLSLAQCTLR